MLELDVFDAENKEDDGGKDEVANAVKDFHSLGLFVAENDIRDVVVDEGAKGPDKGDGNA